MLPRLIRQSRDYKPRLLPPCPASLTRQITQKGQHCTDRKRGRADGKGGMGRGVTLFSLVQPAQPPVWVVCSQRLGGAPQGERVLGQERSKATGSVSKKRGVRVFLRRGEQPRLFFLGGGIKPRWAVEVAKTGRRMLEGHRGRE